MSTTVVNIKSGAKYDVYIGRRNKSYNLQGSIWENPFIAGKNCESVERANYLYAKYLLKHEWMLKMLSKLRGQIIGCWCKPKKCHGDLLAILAEMSFEEAKKYLEDYEEQKQLGMQL